jgi:hypothetical protein
MATTTTPIKVIDQDWATLLYYEDTGIIHHKVFNKITGPQWRELLTRGTDLMEEKGCIKWLSDNRDIDGLSEEDTEWINTVWVSRTVDAGWKYWALVVPNNTMGRVSMTEFVNSFYDVGVRVMVFSNVEEAMEWLERVDQP